MKVIEGIREDKKHHLERLLDRGTVMIFVDARRPGVSVPDPHGSNPQLALNLDYAFQIPDFKIADDRIEVSLSFNRASFFCTIPFTAIYAMRSDFAGEMVFFIEDSPTDMSKAALPVDEPREAPKPVLQDVSQPKDAEITKEMENPPQEKKKKGSHLRVIK